MNHPILVATLAEDRRRHCSCGVVTQEPDGTCRGCCAAAVSRHEAAQSEPPRRFMLDTCRNHESSAPRAGWHRCFQIIGKGAES